MTVLCLYIASTNRQFSLDVNSHRNADVNTFVNCPLTVVEGHSIEFFHHENSYENNSKDSNKKFPYFWVRMASKLSTGIYIYIYVRMYIHWIRARGLTCRKEGAVERGEGMKKEDVSCVPSRMREGATQEGGINSVARVSLRDTLSPFFSFAEAIVSRGFCPPL